MSTAKALGLYAVVGGFVGFLVTSFVMPAMLAWYNVPGAGQALCNCAELVRATTEQLLRAQAGGAAVGAVLFMIVGGLIRRRVRKATAPT